MNNRPERVSRTAYQHQNKSNKKNPERVSRTAYVNYPKQRFPTNLTLCIPKRRLSKKLISTSL